jgi:hypothetical protein
MERRPPANADSPQPIIVHQVQDDLAGVASLLVIARTSVRSQCADTVCIGHLNKCISYLVTRYRIPRPAIDDGAVVGCEAVLRMLRYAQAEMTQNLVDTDCVELLDQCIGRFARIQSAREEDARSIPVN